MSNANHEGALRRELAARNRLIDEFRALLATREQERGALLAQLQAVEQALGSVRLEANQYRNRAESLAQERAALAARLEALQAETLAFHEQRRQELAWLSRIVGRREHDPATAPPALQQLSAALAAVVTERDTLRWQLVGSVVLPRDSVAGRLVRVLRFSTRTGKRLARLSRRPRRPAPGRR
jgi:chromosome segregation ATPase